MSNTDAAKQPLRRPHTCSECGAKITTRGDLQVVMAVVPRTTSRGTVSMKTQRQSRCPQHKVNVAATTGK